MVAMRYLAVALILFACSSSSSSDGESQKVAAPVDELAPEKVCDHLMDIMSRDKRTSSVAPQDLRRSCLSRTTKLRAESSKEAYEAQASCALAARALMDLSKCSL
jgi:hypothetical protein